MDFVEICLLFNRSCTINGLKPLGGGGGGGYPIYDIVQICVPNSPQVYDIPSSLKKKVYEWPDFGIEMAQIF